MGFLGGSDGKASAGNAGDLGLSPGSGRSLETGMATQSSIPAWRISWTEEPGGLQSTGSQRVGHDRVTKYRLFNTEVQKEAHHWDNTFSSYLKLVNIVNRKQYSNKMKCILLLADRLEDSMKMW